MAHEINNTNGKDSVFVVREPAWHGLGQVVQEAQTSEEAIKLAGLDYEVITENIQTESGAIIPNRVATVRADTKEVLGIVGDRVYRVFQNKEAFSFFDSLVGDKLAMYHTAGALGRGERIWLQAKLPKDLIIGDDVVEQYLTLFNSHDGTTRINGYFSPVRVVCANTLASSLRNRSNCISLRHTGKLESKIEEARRVLGITLQISAEFNEICNRMVSVKVDTALVEDYFSKVLKPDFDEDDTIITTRFENQRNKLFDLFERGAGNDNIKVRHTLWTAYNAVTEYVDHVRPAIGAKDDATKKLSNIWLGSGYRMKVRAFEDAVSLMN